MRVNARLDETTRQQLEFLTQATGQSVSHVVRESVAQYYVQVKQRHAPSRFLALAGTGNSGRSDIASNVKACYAVALAQKHPQAGLSQSAEVSSEARVSTAKPTARAKARSPGR